MDHIGIARCPLMWHGWWSGWRWSCRPGQRWPLCHPAPCHRWWSCHCSSRTQRRGSGSVGQHGWCRSGWWWSPSRYISLWVPGSLSWVEWLQDTFCAPDGVSCSPTSNNNQIQASSWVDSCSEQLCLSNVLHLTSSLRGWKSLPGNYTIQHQLWPRVVTLTAIHQSPKYAGPGNIYSLHSLNNHQYVRLHNIGVQTGHNINVSGI